jgi:tryptophan synthase alpha chain
MTAALLSRNNKEAWEAAKSRGEALLIGYLVAGDPSPAESLAIVDESVEAGIDIVEMGIPSRSPKLDGAVIKRGHERALAGGIGTEDSFMAYWTAARRRLSVPIWAMGYKRDVLDTNLYRKLAEGGMVDALVLPDCTPEELISLQDRIGPYGVDVVRFVNSEMDEAAIRQVCRGATVIYAQSYAGTTGDPLAHVEDLSVLCERIRQHLPDGLLVAGFGLRSPQRVGQAVRSGFDGAVVGSALVARCENGEKDYLYRLVAEMKMETLRSSSEGIT